MSVTNLSNNLTSVIDLVVSPIVILSISLPSGSDTVNDVICNKSFISTGRDKLASFTLFIFNAGTVLSISFPVCSGNIFMVTLYVPFLNVPN